MGDAGNLARMVMAGADVPNHLRIGWNFQRGRDGAILRVVLVRFPKHLGGPRVENTHRACFCADSIHKTGRWMCALQSAGMCLDVPKSVYEDPMDAVSIGSFFYGLVEGECGDLVFGQPIGHSKI